MYCIRVMCVFACWMMVRVRSTLKVQHEARLQEYSTRFNVGCYLISSISLKETILIMCTNELCKIRPETCAKEVNGLMLTLKLH